MDTKEPFQSGNPLQQLPELTKEVFFTFHLQIRKMLYLNAAFEDMWNVPRNAAISNPATLLETIHAEDRQLVEEAFANITEDRQKRSIEFRITSDEKVRWIKVDAYFATKGDTDILVGTATDVTAYKDYSDTLLKFSSKKNSILQILSHDLLGPLGNIQMSTTMLSDYAEISENKSIKELINVVTQSSKRSLNMIQDLINQEFLQSSEASIVKQRVDIILNIREMIDQYKQSPRNIQQRFDVVVPADSLYVTIDPSKFMQALNNLVSNALKFTENDGKITLTVEDQGKNVLIKIEDNGVGIPRHLQPFLFDKFTRARRTGIKGEPTTGLGMSIIKTIVDWHDGQIWFESNEGVGTTFFITIPKNG